MDTKQLPILMMVVFLLVIIVGRVVFQLMLTGKSGIHSGTKLKTRKEMFISFLTFGVIGIQTFLTWLISSSRLEPQIEFGLLITWIGIILCISGILFASYSQFAMGKEWRIGVDPGEETQLVTTGIYKTIRNPIYTGCIIHGTGLILLAPHISLLITGIVGYLAIRAYVKEIEEPYLISLHGEKYQKYMSQTGSFFPRF